MKDSLLLVLFCWILAVCLACLCGCATNRPNKRLTDKIRNLEMENVALYAANEYLIKQYEETK